MKTVFHTKWRFFFALVVLFALYASFFIYRTSFVIEGERYFSLFDDAMVSMRYAKNLEQGHGLVMNPGERVEGYTNLLWVLYMAGVHLLPVAQSKISLIIQITGLLLLLINLFFVRKTALLISENNYLVANAAVFLTAFYLPLINWSLQGMEVSLLTLVMSIVVCKAIHLIRSKTFSWGLYTLLGAGTLVRIDMAVPFIGVWFFLSLISPENRRKNLLAGGLVFLVFIAGQTVFRFLYYGDVLPNTYYLKMTGYPILLRIYRGLDVWWRFVWNLNPVLIMLPVLALLFSYDHTKGFIALSVGLQMLYSIYVGGDAWEEWGGSNRYIAFVMSSFFILFAHSFMTASNFIVNAIQNLKTNRLKLGSVLGKYSFPFLVIVSFLQFNNNSSSLNMSGFPLLARPPHVENNKGMVERALLVRQITTPEAKIAVTWSGAIPYFSERYTIDILGKTDRIIAHEDMRKISGIEKFTYFLPGHLKYNYEHSIGELKPDVILQFWGELAEAEKVMTDRYTRLVVGDKFFYLLNGSENILWSKFMKSAP